MEGDINSVQRISTAFKVKKQQKKKNQKEQTTTVLADNLSSHLL